MKKNENEETGDFVTSDRDLSTLLNLAADMTQGKANMDTVTWFMQVLERVEARLAKSP